ncbi:hypothetical protein [Marinobacter subterrani]|uniref:hypothetical protein n=1 Tax=Marinobacter subterrani TaxID=1658765 RepID=UPI002355CAF9|nr:hypothetical protein [Marinobacter subterrani]
MSTPHWSERARESLKKGTEFIAEHGTHIGMAGGGILGTMGAACAAMAIGSGDPMEATMYREGAASLILASVLKAGGFTAAEQIAKTHLKGIDHLFEDPKWKDSAARGAVPVDTSDPTQGPEFRQALKTLFNDLANDPDNRAEVVSLLRSSPMARRALLEGDPSAELKEAQGIQAGYQSGASDDNDPDPIPGPQ